MNFTNIIEYLSQKTNASRSEKLTLQALKDHDFMQEFDNLTYFRHISQLEHVLNKPSNYDNEENANNYGYYKLLIAEVIGQYTVYLYDNKGKYSDLKDQINDLEEKIGVANSDIEHISEVSGQISGSETLKVYAKEFEERAKEYGKSAKKWRDKLYVSFAVLAVVFVLFFFLNIIDADFFLSKFSKDVVYFGYLSAIIIKVLILIGLVQVIRFFGRNYNAEKHLQKKSLHKRDVLQSLHGVYKTMSMEEDSKGIRNELRRTGALIAFQDSESGYITTKEGAGNSDSSIYSVIADIFKK